MQWEKNKFYNGSVDKSITFIPINISLLTISDTRTNLTDKSGDILEDRIRKAGHTLVVRDIVKDDKNQIINLLKLWTVDKKTDVIISTGGTGLTGRDITPEAVESLYDKKIDLWRMFRIISFKKIGTSALQSRSTAGVINGIYVFCLPGSWHVRMSDEILCYQLDIRHKPCNFVEIIPRLKIKSIIKDAFCQI